MCCSFPGLSRIVVWVKIHTSIPLSRYRVVFFRSPNTEEPSQYALNPRSKWPKRPCVLSFMILTKAINSFGDLTDADQP